MRKYQNIIALLFFAALSTLGILNHEIWLDEAQNWLQARDNNSITELFNSIKYEGHPILWNLLLFIITRFTHNVLWMQILHLFIINAAVWIFMHNAPFSFFEKVLFIFGYFIAFEFALIARNYSLTILFLFLAAKYYRSYKKNFIAIGLLLALLANTHLIGLFLSITLSLKCAFDAYQDDLKYKARRQFLIGGLLILSGVVLSIIQILPPGSTPILQPFNTVGIASITKIIPVFIKGFIPIPDFFNYHFWNTNLIISASKPIAGVVSIILFLLPILFLINRPTWLLTFYFYTFLMFCFFLFIKVPAVRYSGIIFIFFIVCLWLSSDEPKKQIFKMRPAIQRGVLISLLLLQVAANAIAFPLEIVRPFSESKNVALFLKNENLLGLDILGEFCESSMFLTYLDKKAYYLDLRQPGSYCHLKEGEEVYNIGIDVMLREATRYTQLHKADALFIHYQPLDLTELGTKNITFIKCFTNSVVNNENFYVYKILYKSE